ATASATTFFDLYFTDPERGSGVGSQGAIFPTITSGEKWVDRTLPCGSPCIRPPDFLKVQFTGFLAGWIIGERGAFLTTSDAGFTWDEPELSEPFSLYGLSFPDPKIGWAVGEGGTILKIAPAS
ncbi:MAG: hypothetical protein F4Z24_07190, partial [Nitrospira sp. SB0666_bin_27]|nr:hypothetical protein [Nitrospira sp. SB0666_bin_27]